jgi:hypothetical protein
MFAPVWESTFKGTKYRATGRDLKEAKEFLAMNDDIFDELPEFQEHAQEYLKSTFDGWRTLGYPCWGLLRHYNTYAPKKIKEQVRRVQMISCPDCQTNHEATKQCPKCYA